MALCCVTGCHNQRGGSHARCNYHRNLREKELDLARWAYRKLKSNCARRQRAAPEWKKTHYDFTITLEYFRQFCEEREILMGRGRTAQSLQIDRVEEEKGYTPGNLQDLTNRENITKEHCRRKGIIFDYELVYRRRRGRYRNEEEARMDEGQSEFRYVEYRPEDNEDDYAF